MPVLEPSDEAQKRPENGFDVAFFPAGPRTEELFCLMAKRFHEAEAR
jgi:hypothetical protein